MMKRKKSLGFEDEEPELRSLVHAPQLEGVVVVHLLVVPLGLFDDILLWALIADLHDWRPCLVSFQIGKSLSTHF